VQPERIDPQGDPSRYGIRSDVWSLGISMVEIASGKFPYKTWGTPFDQLKQVVMDDPPRLPTENSPYGDDLHNFIASVLVKKYEERPSYSQLLVQPFIASHADSSNQSFADFIAEIMPSEGD
ncbi:Protein kinase domain, partial [Trinorchestia longiramus]